MIMTGDAAISVGLGDRKKVEGNGTYEAQKKLLPNFASKYADFLSSDWFMRLWEGQPFSFAKILVMSL